jgi:hypothetical protein
MEGAMDRHTTIVSRSPRAAFREIARGQGAVILNLDTADYHGVNEIGSVIWSLLEEPKTIGDLAKELRLRLQDSPPDLEDDLIGFVSELERRDLVVIETS